MRRSARRRRPRGEPHAGRPVARRAAAVSVAGAALALVLAVPPAARAVAGAVAVGAAGAGGPAPARLDAVAGPDARGGPAAADVHVVHDRWYVLRLDGRPVGSMRLTRLRGAAGPAAEARLETRRVTRLRVRRGETEVALLAGSSFVEDVDGRPLAARAWGGPTGPGGAAGTAWRFVSDGIVATDEGGDAVDAAPRPRPLPPRPWLTPAAVDLLVASRIEGGARRIAFTTLDPGSGLAAVDTELVADGRERIDVGDRRIAASRWRVHTSAAPDLASRQWRSRDGVLLRESVPTPAGPLVAELADEAAARSALAGSPPEVLAAGAVVAEGRLDPAWRRVRYLVRRDEDEAIDAGAGAGAVPGSPVPADARQRVTREADGWWHVDVSASDAEPPSTDATRGTPAPPSPPGPADLAATPLVDADDPAVRRLAARAVRGLPAGGDAAARAEAMRRRVHAHVRDDAGLDRLWDSASTTARTGRGDCSEHAVLLAAMLRAEGIPARLAIGLVHAEAIDGPGVPLAWHLWTRAWIDGAWHELDATRPAGVGPGHLRLGETAGGDAEALARVAALAAGAGRLRVRIAGGEP